MGVMLYESGVGEAERQEVAQGFGRRYGAREKLAGGLTNERDAERRLRIGYVSSDLYEHPVGRNLEPVLVGRDRGRFEVVAYAEGGRADARRERLQGQVEEWREIAGLSDGAVAEQVRQDGIDILVILAGRFDRNRPLVASYRAAPVQVSFHDPGTSGVGEMDYLIADPDLVPRRGEEKFEERVVRLGRFYVHEPLAEAPEVSAPPSGETGRITFGSFNNPAKVSGEVLGLWGEVLNAVPGSVLRVKFKNWFANAGLRERFVRGLGVGAERIEFVAEEEGLAGHLGGYGEIDIALDPYPFTGSTTTFEALWMGVPVVTLMGRSMAGRWSGSMLRAVKLEELIAGSPAEYVAIARRLAEDPRRLAELRAGLRGRVAASSLCDGRRRARQLDRLYRALWRRYCASSSA
jgi:predicted O-linked N-acetylglucosamine transferase (SPINDLY family)